jgi:hypothetical protein
MRCDSNLLRVNYKNTTDKSENNLKSELGERTDCLTFVFFKKIGICIRPDRVHTIYRNLLCSRVMRSVYGVQIDRSPKLGLIHVSPVLMGEGMVLDVFGIYQQHS